MRIYHVPCGESTIELGRAGENLAQQIVFNVSDWLAAFGAEGGFSLDRKSTRLNSSHS